MRVAVAVCLACMGAHAQSQDSAPLPSAPKFEITGSVKSGETPPPGVTITAAHSLTGQKVVSSSDVDGSYAVRENQNGRMGSFEGDIELPDLRKEPVRMSTVVIASQRVAGQRKSQNPLVKDGREIIPNVAHVFTKDQPLLFYYEVYDPAKPKTEQNGDNAKRGRIHLMTSIQFFKGKLKVYETPLVEAHELNSPERRAASFELEVPAAQLQPGWYTCQVNVIDDAAGKFTFPRLPLLVR
jgi:hypothetical protein